MRLDEFSAVLWKLGEQGGLDFGWPFAAFLTLIAADVIALVIAIPALRRPRWCALALLPIAWALAFYLVPTCPVWMMQHPCFFLRIPAALLAGCLVSILLSRTRALIQHCAGAIVFFALAGGAVTAPFLDNIDMPRRTLANDAPTFAIERLVDAGDFKSITERPIHPRKLLRLEIAYRALAAFRVGHTNNPGKTPGARGWESSKVPQALMDGFKLLYAYGFLLPARRLILELRGETEAGRKIIHDRYLGDIAFICGERRLAEHHYRLLAKSRLFRETALSRLEAVRSGKTPFDLPELKDVAMLYLIWKQDATEKEAEYFQHEQNIEEFVYIHFDAIKTDKLAPLEIEPVTTKTIDPDFNGAEIPWNIAPMNFDLIGRTARDHIAVAAIAADGDSLNAKIRCAPQGGEHTEDRVKVTFNEKNWADFLAKHRGGTIAMRVLSDNSTLTNLQLKISADAIDRALVYRLIEPSYGVFGEMSIVERELSNFRETVLDSNHDEQPGERRCMNCHTPLKDGHGSFMRHLRGKTNGTLISSAKHGRKFVNLREADDKESPAYPAWHPSGDFIVFSKNQTRQSFKYVDPQKIEVYDLSSSLMLYSLADGALVRVESAPDEKECYPAWDPSGQLLFSSCCRTNNVYDLRVRRFEPASRKFSAPETIIDANSSNLSVLHPRISPDGRWAVVTTTTEGVFPIWHRDSNLYVINLVNRTARFAAELNSGEAETFHNFSTNGRWLVFASRRDNGTVTRLYLTHFDPATGLFSTPFRLPAADPEAESIRRFSYNAPDFNP